jgi:hypothetical protein
VEIKYEAKIEPVPLKNIGSAIDVTDIFKKAYVYLLRRGADIVYIGQSKTLSSRLSTHLKSEKDFDTILAIPVELEELSAVEGAFIRVIKPEYNVLWAHHDPLGEDLELVREFGFHISEKRIYETEPLKPLKYGLVLHEDRIGVYDDDSYECNCHEFYEKHKLDRGIIPEDVSEALCKQNGCKEMAIVYFDGFLDDYEVLEYEELESLADPDAQINDSSFRKLMSHVPGDTHEEWIKNMGFVLKEDPNG